MENQSVSYSEFILRRLHSLTGLIPLTFFIIFHFFANAFSTVGEDAFNQTVDTLRGLPFLIAIEWAFLFAPFLFHMFYGLWIIFAGRPNPLRENYARNWAYLLQRITAIIVFVFIIYHVVSLHYLSHRAIDPTTNKLNFYKHLANEFQSPAVYWWYVIGIASTVYHLANGLTTFCITWGITVGRRSQQMTAAAVTMAGLILFVVGISALNGFKTDVQRAAGQVTQAQVQEKAIP